MLGRALLVGALLTLASAHPAAAAIRARQPAAGAEVELLPIEGPGPVDAFYAYNTTSPSSAATGFETLDTSLLFFHLQLPGPLSLVVIHDRPTNAAGGAAVFSFRGLPATTTYAVRDDVGDSYVPDPPAGGQTTATWNWNLCCTDGLALSMPASEPFCIDVAPTFTSGITSWVTLSGPTTAVTRSSVPSLADDVFLCLDCLTLTCPPVVDILCAPGGGAPASVVASGSSLCGGVSIVNDFNAGGADASGVYPVGTTAVTFTLTDVVGYLTSCTTQVNVTNGVDPIPPDQGNLLLGVKAGPDVDLLFVGAPATRWRLFHDPSKRTLGRTPLVDTVVPTYRDAGAIARATDEYYRLRGLSPCSLTQGP